LLAAVEIWFWWAAAHNLRWQWLHPRILASHWFVGVWLLLAEAAEADVAGVVLEDHVVLLVNVLVALQPFYIISKRKMVANIIKFLRN